MNHNFKNLKIWNLSMQITSEIHLTCLGFPKYEMYGLSSQMNRASVSIPSNIAEGSNRGNKHFSQFLNISLGSSFELHTQLLIAQMHNYVSKEKTNELEIKIIELQKMIAGFIAKLN